MSIQWYNGHILWSGGHIAMSPDCCCDGPCDNEYPLCGNCSWTHIPRLKLQATLPNTTQTQYVLTKTGEGLGYADWEYSDDNVTFHVTYDTKQNPSWIVQCFLDNAQWQYRGSGPPPISGSLYFQYAQPPMPTNIAFRLCALGVNIPKEYTVTTSGISVCPEYTDVWNPTNCSVNNLIYFRGIVQGDLNTTTDLSLIRYYKNTSGCAIYRSEPIATVRLSQYNNKDPVVWNVYVQITNNNTIDIYASGSVPGGWLMIYDPPQVNCTGSVQLFHAADQGMCDSTITVNNSYLNCNTGQNNSAYGGTATTTPTFDNGWTPPQNTWI